MTDGFSGGAAEAKSENYYTDDNLKSPTVENNGQKTEKADPFQSFVAEAINLSRDEFNRKYNEFIENHGTPEEARACEVSGQFRQKYWKQKNRNTVEKQSLGADYKGFRLQFIEDGKKTSKRFGWSFPFHLNLTQITVSPSAEKLKKLLETKGEEEAKRVFTERTHSATA